MCVGGLLGMSDDFPDYLAIVGDAFLKSCERHSSLEHPFCFRPTVVSSLSV